MRSTFAPLAFAALVAANPVPAGVSSAVAPEGTAPAGCSPNYSGSFQISVVKTQSKREIESRQDSALILTLSGGVLKDSQGRTGYVASNNQFQFDKPPQAGAIYTSGFSVCSNNSLAIGDDTTWYQCLSGTFYNLYDDNSAAQCSPVNIEVVGSGGSAPAASQQPDGQITATSAVAPVTQISDGQIQATTATPVCTQIVDGQPQCESATVAPVMTTPVCTQIVDGQPQCESATAAPTTTAAPVCTEYKDGQPQCGGSAPYPTGGYGTGGVAQPTGTGALTPSSYAPIATGAAAINGPVAGLLAVAGLAAAMI